MNVDPNYPPPDFYDPVIEFYKQRVNLAELRENLKLTPTERMEKFERRMEGVYARRKQLRGLLRELLAELQLLSEEHPQ